MVRARDEKDPCILSGHNRCDRRNRMECGHFIERERMATRFHPWNVNKECCRCNTSHVSGYRPDKGFPYGLAIDAKWGDGTAKFLYKISRPIHQWTTDELNFLKDAARRGSRVYEQAYFELRRGHQQCRARAA